MKTWKVLLSYLIFTEVDIAYFDKYLVISHFHNIRFVQLTADEIKTTIRQF